MAIDRRGLRRNVVVVQDESSRLVLAVRKEDRRNLRGAEIRKGGVVGLDKRSEGVLAAAEADHCAADVLSERIVRSEV